MTKIRAIDPNTDFHRTDSRILICGRCRKLVGLRDDKNSVDPYKQHRKSQRCSSTNPGQLGLSHFLSPTATAPSKPAPLVTVACTGLTAKIEPRIPIYLSRTEMGNGGAPHRSTIQQILISEHEKGGQASKAYTPSKEEIRLKEWALSQWVNRHDLNAVFSKNCLGTITIQPSGGPVCANCLTVPKIKIFQNALKRTAPENKNMKFTPREFRNPLWDQYFLRMKILGGLWRWYATSYMSNRYEGMKVFKGLLETTMIIEQRQHKGKGLQNIKYPAEYDHLMTTLALTSARAYNLVQGELGGRTLRGVR
ncbi:hypothetical protein C8R42DRAFT_588015 [Lentinula raphanica]|nr:hypothetical protein C8R42DRAFT_588015 [Lentinula raphanica]